MHNADCWCMKYPINEENKAYISLHYEDCLCEDCLKKFTEIKPKQD